MVVLANKLGKLGTWLCLGETALKVEYISDEGGHSLLVALRVVCKAELKGLRDAEAVFYSLALCDSAHVLSQA